MEKREETSLPPTPKYVRRGVADLKRAIGVEPTIEFNDGRWLLVVNGERAKLTWEFRYLSTGRLQYNKAPMLTVDGKTRKLEATDDRTYLRSLFNPPQETSSGATEVLVKHAPAIVQHNYWAIANYFASRGVEAVVRVTQQDHLYSINLEMETKSLRMRFSRNAGRWNYDPERPIQLIVDGEDRSADVAGNLAKALAALCGTPGPPASGGPPAIGGPSSPARNNSVETRRSTVIRV